MSATLQRAARTTPALYNGDRMTQREFHRVYERMPEDVRAELIEGVVYMASPLSVHHGDVHCLLATLLGMYAMATTGVRPTDNATTILGEDDEPQPDLSLRILPEYGGQTRTQDNYIAGAPELIVEVAHSSRAIDLHAKRRAYARHGGIEYLVADLEDARLHWIDLRTDQDLTADPDGVCRMHTFPGLWMDGPALFAYNVARLTATLNAGLASAEHATFVAALAARRSET
ncbi:MAG TPA: Uma2 family endonuclease [Gemmataceae bacterium]|nr:Uma2 family endonuclease [Gemmataceae bacterium]